MPDHLPPEHHHSLHQLRIKLSSTDALPQLTCIGMLIGLLAGGLLILFREIIHYSTSFWLPMGDEHFETLPDLARFIIPVIGSVFILLLFSCASAKRRSVGILHVVERLQFHKGKMSFTSMVLQFFGAIMALIGGFSVGREGPAVHVGAATGSLLGQKLKLPQNTLRILAACGGAAAISASFNTPMAGVIFAMEVVVRQYALNSFIPVMAAAVMAAVLSQIMYGPDPAFVVPVIPMASLTELGIAAASACLIGILAAGFIRLQLWTASKRQQLFINPIILAGLFMGTVGYFLPAVMGIGYDTIELILNGELMNITFLLILMVAKLVTTAVVTGLGIPGGIIGPSLMMGALAGAAFGHMGDFLLNLPDVSSAFHALLGMVAMMAAVLQAPMAALVTVLELTRNPHIIMPAMFTIVIACLIAGRLTSRGGLIEMQLLAKGYSHQHSLLKQLLSQKGVATVMSRHFELLDNKEIVPVPVHASLQDALEIMETHSVEVLGVYTSGRRQSVLCGVVTREAIDNFYR
ncbi:chloride channel protein [Endozoicomonas montiporae]|uniref:Cl-channel, voltage-gated family protein n=1 Tax=Endozoicomonas montiporae CL-33 TaxID=570277 RepID=A0A142B938_9GAMM|nr:chloride channel protein [Endozoicomonas montiporae]AMO55264.1 Cl-channel, voltage-gated family protein [Endozoicomonas montiporae CL-33]